MTRSPRAISESYRHCAKIARRSASNFWFSFFLLPSEKRRAMCALYAFLRRTDDLGDSSLPVDSRRAAIRQWREQLAAFAQRRAADSQVETAPEPILPALFDAIQKFRIPLELLTAAIDGVESDLDRSRFETFEELRHYCYQVASTVGLACVRIWGYSSDAAFAPARACGVAFQMTNILRDLDEDARRGRVYLPAADMRRFGYSAEELLARENSAQFLKLFEFEMQRTEAAYAEAAELLAYLPRDGRRVFAAMLATYRALLDCVGRQRSDAFGRRARLSRWKKLRIAAHSILAPRHVVVANSMKTESVSYGLTQAGS
jgi:phytoene synthase